ncbi:Diacylglycerol kinase [bacterium HR17]|jgi:diacylglycerol kinase (ATP)|uniref:Diacylglycerol kinase n=1 Tax=Candidatus Fervidibacter japonicus TaxID=2035412 RepID=A0A2H5XCC9_9BACT|nr:Diacylglycerol kinase [bacterium HR17]
MSATRRWETVLLIVNPHAGGGKGRRWAARLEAALRQRFARVRTVLTEKSGSAAEAVARYDAELVVVAGGDGVFHDAINGAMQTRRSLPFILVPIGTGNVLASNLGIPKDPLRALAASLDGQLCPLDLGQAHDRFFHCSLGIGLDAYVVAQMEAERASQVKRLLGKVAYLLAALRHSVRYEWSHVRIEAELADGCEACWERDAWLVLVTNVADYGGVNIAPDARPDDGALDLVVLPAHSKVDYFRFGVLGWLGWHLRHPEVVVRPIRRARIVSAPPVPTQLDGEPAPTTPVDVQVVPRALTVLLPRTPLRAQHRVASTL